MAQWLIPCNVSEIFDLSRFLESSNIVYWIKGRHSYREDDTAFIYLSRVHRFVKYKFRIVSVNCNIDDFEYSQDEMQCYVACWLNHDKYQDAVNINQFIKLEYVSETEDPIPYRSLVERGVRNKMRTSIKMGENLAIYISACFND